ncbi:uncharacterized protein L201_006320 [Kwoniella dendrophila CBS 6074]|uniref:GH16 domain-containing protein n=1 Tax=Kwoniella dendrophila CBS 6074 TaxID=1295534 RepID=A0AAX4K3D3_9TREE
MMFTSQALFFLLPALAHAIPWNFYTHRHEWNSSIAITSTQSSSSSLASQATITGVNGTVNLAARPTSHSSSSTRKRSSTTTTKSGSTTSKISSSSTTTPAVTSSTNNGTSPTPSKDCSCGYILSKYDNAYFPKSLIVLFDNVSDVNALSQLGFYVNNGDSIGVGYQGNSIKGSSKNVIIKDGLLQLTVPGGQKAASGSQLSGAEIQTSFAVTGGIFTMNAKLSSVHGTCQSIFTYTENQDVGLDEMDIEMVYSDPGVQMANFDPSGSGANDFQISTFPNDPTTGFNDFTIGWFKDAPKYYYNGQVLKGPTKYVAKNPSNIVINNWSSGDPGFTQGPPTQDTTLQVKSVSYYYQTKSESGYPSGCSQAQACVV